MSAIFTSPGVDKCQNLGLETAQTANRNNITFCMIDSQGNTDPL